MSELATFRSGHNEATPQNHADPDFRKSSYSNQAQNCVEVADVPGASLVRDTQNRELGHLAFPSAEWRALISTTRREK